MKCNQWIEGTIEPHGLPYCRCGGDIPSPWRDVREALPDNDVPVLVYCQYASDMEYEIDIAYITDLAWTSSTTGEIIDVKYWAELPAPPRQRGRRSSMKCKHYEDNVFKEYACKCDGEISGGDEYLLLKLKDLLLTKEYEIQVGRMELEQYGKWQTNHGEAIGYIDQEIDFLYQKIEGRV